MLCPRRPSSRRIPVEVRDGKIFLYARIDHCLYRDANISVPEWQKTMPLLLLLGEYGHWNIEQENYDYIGLIV